MTRNGIFSLAGRTALVAGASRGIGLAIAQGLARAGAHTLLGARGVEALERESAALREEGFEAQPVTLDLADADSVRAAIEAHPGIDILVNVAGINHRKRFEDYTRREYDRILDTNLHGIVQLTQLAGKGMIERGRGGKIIFIGSMTSLLGLPYVSVYGITKSALAGLTRVLAAEWGPHNIQVNCIAPGMILTDLNRAMWQSERMREWFQGVAANPSLGSPADVAPLAVFLAGRGADYITGQVIAVDGGYSTTARWPFEP
ncbi:MAG: SDR family oxidoreductase [Acidobacteria bacterium]|nr:SDR family oxidoreductase [Acidobacteriota bacterium]